MNYYTTISKFSFVSFVSFVLLFSLSNLATAEDKTINAVVDQLQIIAQDLKTLEKAVYKTSDITTAANSFSSSGLNEEILTRHLLKLNEIEEQFSILTNRFEEVNFKLDKLSNRVTKIQSDSQLRFSDLETGRVTPRLKGITMKKKIKLKEKKNKLDYQALISHKILVQHQVTV